MAGAKKKSKPPMWMVLAAFVVVSILVIISRSREKLVVMLEPPAGGVKKLYTIDDRLVAIGVDNDILIYNWKDLYARGEKSSVRAAAAVWLGADEMLWANGSSDMLFVSDLSGEKIKKRLSFQFGWKCGLMVPGGGGDFAALGFFENGKKDGAFRVGVYERASAEISDILMVEGVVLDDLCISDGGDYVGAVGLKGQAGWIAVISVKDKKMLWEREFGEVSELGEAVFSVDGARIYCGGPGRVVYELDARTGETAHEYVMEKSELPNKKQYIACITVTSDGRFVAACTGPSNTAYIWRADSRELVQTMGVGVKKSRGGVVVNNLAFSAANDLIASGDMTAIRKINVFKSAQTAKAADNE